MATQNCIFTSFAVEDTNARDLLVGQAKHEDSPFEFVNMSVKEPWSESWKTRCRSKIKGCDGVIALLGTDTIHATGARWEMQYAIEEGISIIGVHIYKNEKGVIPPELRGETIIEWTWDGIADLIDSL